jgi:hypothetical protein
MISVNKNNNQKGTQYSSCSHIHDLPEEVDHTYQIDGNVLGQGAFAKILRGVNRQTGEEVALKVRGGKLNIKCAIGGGVESERGEILNVAVQL